MNKRPIVALFLRHPECSIDCGNGILQSLQQNYNFKIFTSDMVDKNFFNDVDVVAFPGGIGDSDRFYKLLKNIKNQIQDFVGNGGHYLGICMGAYWADKHYFDILEDVRAVQYIKRPHTDTRRPHPKACTVVWNNTIEKMYFYDGCTFTGTGKFDTIARYANNDPMAIIQNKIGLIGCHPESELSWYDKSYLIPHWHNHRHHKLLLNFVDHLVK